MILRLEPSRGAVLQETTLKAYVRGPVWPKYFRLTPWVVTETEPDRVCIAEAHRVSLKGEVNAVHELHGADVQRATIWSLQIFHSWLRYVHAYYPVRFSPDLSLLTSICACVLPCPLHKREGDIIRAKRASNGYIQEKKTCPSVWMFD